MQRRLFRPLGACGFAFILIAAMSSCGGELLTVDQLPTVEQLEGRVAELELQLETALNVNRGLTSAQLEVSTSVPLQPETTDSVVDLTTNNVQFSPSAMQAEFWGTVGDDRTVRAAWFGLVGENYFAVEVLNPDNYSAGVSLSLYRWDGVDGWEAEPTFEINDFCCYFGEGSSVRFFDATGNGVEDIVLNYQGGKRMTGNVVTLLDGEWVDTGAFQRPEYAQPGRMRITYQSCDPSCAEGDDVSSWGYWTGKEWKACSDAEAPLGCNYYWTGG